MAMSDEARELYFERVANRRERSTVRRSERRAKVQEFRAADRGYRAQFGGAR